MATKNKAMIDDDQEVKSGTKGSILELEQNLDDYDDFEVLPKGAYPATIILSEERISDKGNEYYYIQFQILRADYSADYAVENAPEGTNLTYARIQKPTPKNRRSITAFKNFMRAIGVSLNTSTFNPGDWEGKKAKLTISEGEWQGQPNNQIVSVEALD